jgi:hypothetical protein
MHSTRAGAYPHPALAVRTDQWLREALDDVWARHFADTPHVNRVQVSFAGPWKSRLGLITMAENQLTTYIQINSLLRYPEVPGFVLTITVAHEMVHYVHGFGSPLPQRFKHPHRGGIVKRELVRRGLAEEYDRYDEWVYSHWYDFYERQSGLAPTEEDEKEGAVALRLAAE